MIVHHANAEEYLRPPARLLHSSQGLTRLMRSRCGNIKVRSPPIANDRFAISLRLVRYSLNANKKPMWAIQRRVYMLKGHIIALRLNDGNRGLLDYLFLPTGAMIGPN